MGSRKSGFTTIQKVSVRKGDAVSIATLSLIAVPPIVEKQDQGKRNKAPVKEIKKDIKKDKVIK